MYNIHDFIARRCCIVIKKPEQYKKTMEWFRKYRLTFYEGFLDEQFNFYEVKDTYFACNARINSPTELLHGVGLVDTKLVVCRTGHVATIEEMDFDENRLYD